MTQELLYFAYGSNLSSRRLLARTPSARCLTRASLSGHQLRFHKIGRDGSAKCDAYATGRAQDQVWGVVYRLDQAEKPLLDQAEGLGAGYVEKTVRLTTEDGRSLQAFTYCATRIDPGLKPFSWYREHVLRGAQERGFPAAYCASIAAQETRPDADEARHARELAIYTAGADQAG